MNFYIKGRLVKAAIGAFALTWMGIVITSAVTQMVRERLAK